MEKEKEIYGYIYKIRNTVNEKVYIGLTKHNFNERYNVKGEGIERVYNYHAGLRKHGKRYNRHLLHSIEKYGFEAFEVIKEFDIAYSEEELKEKEKYWISYYKSNDVNYGYNRTEGGDGTVGLKGKEHPMYGKHHSEEAKKRQSEAHKGKKYNEEHRKNISEGRKGIKFSEEHRKNIGESRKGKHLSEEHRKNIGESLKGHKVSEETRRKQSEAHKGREFSEEHKRNLSEAHRGKETKTKGIKNGFAKSVVAIFPSGRIIKDVCVTELALELRITRDLVRKILRSKKPYKVPNGSKFEYLKPLEGIIIMTQEDYLNANINDNDKAS